MDLIGTREITTPRCIYQHPAEDVLECTLHGFGDASQKAYCAVIYFVYRTNIGIYVRLLTSKARVAPLKTTSIPRLELMSARLLAQVMNSVIVSLENQVKVDSIKFWLDSMTALYWIMNRGEWEQFVRHRVNEILKLTNKGDWGHCPGRENPADIGSRGVVASQLKDNQLWWVGPDWLAKSEDEWPSGKVTDKTASVLEEECKSVIMVVEVKESARVSNLINLKDYGAAEDLFRLTAWVLRFVFNVQAKARNTDRHRGYLKVDKLVEAENLWIKDAQMELKTDKKYPQLSNSLGLMEEEGILLCKGRFKNSDLEFKTKHPIIMPKDHRLTELLVEKCHSEVHHCGIRATLSRMRTKYWVVKGRQMIKKVIG